MANHRLSPFPNSRFQRNSLPPPLTYYSRQGLRLFGRGEWRTAKCPFHDDRHPSLRVNVNSGGFCCMVCAARGGDILDFHRLRYALNFVDAARALGAWTEAVR